MGSMFLNRSSATLHAVNEIQTNAEQVKHLLLTLKGNLMPEFGDDTTEGVRNMTVLLGLGSDLADRILRETERIPIRRA